MTKVIAYHNNANGDHWFKSSQYGKSEIEAIKDPEGGNTLNPPTSIPSPFARFDLVRAAFANLSRNPNLKGTPNDERLVSEALDVALLFFNYDKIKDKVKIIPWSVDKNNGNLGNLLNPKSSEGHKRLGKVLELYLNQDANIYNFDKLNRLFILQYQGKIVGGTSPSTLFFSSANDLSALGLAFDTQLFDKTYTPLYKRDIDYQKFWYCLKLQNNFRTYFREIDDYLENSFKALEKHNPTLYHQHICSQNGELLLKQGDYSQLFEQLNAGQQGNIVEVLDIPICKRKVVASDVEKISDFVIDTTKYRKLFPNEPIPLVLQNNYHKSLQYTQAKWKNGLEIPSFVAEDWRKNERQLPAQSENYPWLTVSDLLEPYLIRVKYPINTQDFWVGNLYNLPDNDKAGYLLPIKNTFFEFFDIEDLKNGNGKVKVQIKEGHGHSIDVSLQIPIKGDASKLRNEYITLERSYIFIDPNEPLTEPNLKENIGYIVEQTFGLSMYPFIKSGNEKINADYRVQLIEDLDQYDSIKLQFYELSEVKEVNTLEKKRSDAGDSVISKYYALENEFDYISFDISNNNLSLKAIMIPNWNLYNGGTDTLSFAIDFGTTNTHIEFKKNNSESSPFQFGRRQVALMMDLNYYQNSLAGFNEQIKSRFDFEFLPIMIGQDIEYSFPLRSVIAQPKDFSGQAHTLIDINTPFYYEKRNTRDRDRITPNLKWIPRDAKSELQVYHFLEELIMMIRNKVLLEGGNLSATKIYWFYPSSMTRGRKGKLKEKWDELFRKHITNRSDAKPIEILESIAPFYHYQNVNTQINTSSAVSIDIGGGSSDIAIYRDNRPVYLTSFRFAGNAIYGDFLLERGAKNNGFVNRYKQYFEELLETNTDLENFNNKLLEDNCSEEIISFWFGLEKNRHSTNDKNRWSFNKQLSKDDNLRIVFLLFYTASVYHVVKLMVANNFDKPRTITFSGTGAKMLDIITGDAQILEEFTQKIIEQVYGTVYGNREKLVVYKGSTPKEATCKGALLMDVTQIEKPLSPSVYAGVHENKFESLRYEDLQNAEIIDAILQETENFIQFFLNMNKQFSFENNFDISKEAIVLTKNVLNDADLRNFLNKAIEAKKKGLTEIDTELEETLFFYPIMGTMNQLAFEISNQL
ncbi:hypothetical protein LV89_01013 [Arcicella aurantiaca]|uniref:Ppx/GppA phosphatase family protein n=1 Tax=Arcicella aurantiaca TaxID=591202 RepID=A0A316EEX9_9BACT|nr:cell division protein FtsA [Arcicella aurantiaca]PWK28232.1 hypothetical protein LV89_01013 [Arcicella aurantiaca]